MPVTVAEDMRLLIIKQCPPNFAMLWQNQNTFFHNGSKLGMMHSLWNITCRNKPVITKPFLSATDVMEF